MHSQCDPQPVCSSQHLFQDLNVLQQHLDLMSESEGVLKLSQMIGNYGASFQKFSEAAEKLREQVAAAVEADEFMDYEALKILINQ